MYSCIYKLNGYPIPVMDELCIWLCGHCRVYACILCFSSINMHTESINLTNSFTIVKISIQCTNPHVPLQ